MARPRVTIIRKLRRVEDILPPRVEAQMPADAHVEQRNTLRSTTIGLCFAVMLLMLTAFSAARASSTISYFSDSELSAANAFNAGQLNFLVGESAGAQITVTEGDADGEAVMPTVTLDAGSFDLRYRVTATQTGGDAAFCNALQVDSTNGAFSYDGPLIGLDTGSTSVVGAWQFNVILPADSGVSDGAQCLIDLQYAGWIDGEPSSNGYLDGEIYSLAITASVPPPAFAPLSLSASADILTLDAQSPEEETESEERKREDLTEPPAEARGEDRDESRAEDRETERDHSPEPPTEVIVETVNVPPAAETPTVTETLPVPEEEPSV